MNSIIIENKQHNNRKKNSNAINNKQNYNKLINI